MKPRSSRAPSLALMLTLPLLALAQAPPAGNKTTAAVALPTTAYADLATVGPGSAARNPSMAAVQLDLAERMAADLADWTTELSEGVGLAGSLRETRFARGALKVIREIGQFNKKLSIGASLFTFVASMLLRSETEVLAGAMLRRFQEVNQKLNSIQRQLDRATKRLQVVQEATESLATYRLCHNAVRNGALRLSDILNRMGGARTRRQLARLAEEYTTWYETSEIDNRLMNLHRAATRESTPNLGTNLFHSYAELHDCSTSRLIELMLGVMYDLEVGAELRLAYHFFRNGADRAASQFQTSKKDLYEVRTAFDRRYWYCLENTEVVSASAARKLLQETTALGMTATVAASHVLRGLERRFHRFYWAVALGASNLNPSSSFETGNFFQLPTTPRLLVLFVDSEQSLRCSDANSTSTRLIFECSPNTCAIATSTGIVGSQSCPGISIVGAEKSDWLVSILDERGMTCSSRDACSGHGYCRHRAGLTRPVCLCDPEYQGDRCAVKDDPTAVSSKLIADMRDSVGQFTGVQTTVDVYYQLLDVQTNLIRELRGLSACTELSSLINSDIINEAMYMADIYGQLLRGHRKLEQFGELMQTHVGGRNLDYFLKSLLDRLLGTNRLGLPTHGILHMFKQCLVTAHRLPPCSNRYATSVQRLMTSLALMDEAVGEALLTYFSWKQDRTSRADKLVLAYLVDEYKNRTAQFRDHWSAQSCPSLSTLDRPLGAGLSSWDQRFCNASHSYEGLELSVNCSGLRHPRSPKITCSRGADGRLAWSPQPHCDESWAEWSEWSSCSVTCGTGYRIRQRCLGEKCSRKDSSTSSCSRVDCCAVQHGEGKFIRCQGKCVSRERVCDGTPDCPDGSDEAACEFVRAGQQISLRAVNFQAYALNCYCASRCLIQPVHCYMKYCANWHTGCSDEYARYSLYSPERSPGEVLYSGDTIGLMYDWGKTNWLSCTRHDGKCTTRNCPGGDVRRVSSNCGGEKFILYTVENTGRCRGQANCVGRPIRRGERVALRHPSGWLSAPAMDTEVRVRNCMRHRSMVRAAGCPTELWVIHN